MPSKKTARMGTEAKPSGFPFCRRLCCLSRQRKRDLEAELGSIFVLAVTFSKLEMRSDGCASGRLRGGGRGHFPPTLGHPVWWPFLFEKLQNVMAVTDALSRFWHPRHR
jgi:hypothetical protein